MSQMVKNLPANIGDSSSISESERSPGEGNDNLLQYSCLEDHMDRGACHFHFYVKGVKWGPLQFLSSENGSFYFMIILTGFIIFKSIFNWSIVDSQCCIFLKKPFIEA